MSFNDGKVYKKFNPQFAQWGIDVEGPLSRLLYRLQTGPNVATIKRNFDSLSDMEIESVPKLRNIIASLQTGGLEAYREIVPNLAAAIMGWQKIHSLKQSMECYERLSLAICGVELMSEMNHLESHGYSKPMATAIARRCLFPRWDDSDDCDEPEAMEKREDMETIISHNS